MVKPQPTFLDSLNSGFASPMFQFGANLFAGSAQGNPGSGVAAGAQAAGQAQNRQMVQQRQQQEFEAEQARAAQVQADAAQKQKLFLESIAGEDPKLQPILQMVGPQAAGRFLMDRMQGPEQTASIKEYNYAKQNGYQGSYTDFKTIGSSNVDGRKLVNQDGNLWIVEPGKDPRVLARKAPSLAERFLDGAMAPQGQAQPAQPQGGFIQQSNPVQPGTDPNLQLTAGGEQPQSPQAAPAQPDMITLPNGRQIPRQQAEQLRFGLALDGNKAGADAIDALLNPPLAASEKIGEAGSNEVDKQLINSGNALSRLQEIQRQFKPEFQVWENRASMAIKDTLDRFGFARGSISPEDRAKMGEYRKFRVSAIDNINRYIKEITGAQMSEAEATRLRQGAPDAGDNPVNPWSGDSPSDFKSKMQQTIRMMGLVQMRFNYLKKNGFAGNGEQAEGLLSLDQMGNKVQQRTRQLQQRARAEGVPDAQMRPWVQQNLKQEFGI